MLKKYCFSIDSMPPNIFIYVNMKKRGYIACWIGWCIYNMLLTVHLEYEAKIIHYQGHQQKNMD